MLRRLLETCQSTVIRAPEIYFDRLLKTSLLPTTYYRRREYAKDLMRRQQLPATDILSKSGSFRIIRNSSSSKISHCAVRRLSLLFQHFFSPHGRGRTSAGILFHRSTISVFRLLQNYCRECHGKYYWILAELHCITIATITSAPREIIY